MNNPNEHAETLKMKPGPNKTWSSILVPLLLAQLYAQSLLPSIECHPLGHFDVPVVLAPGQITKRDLTMSVSTLPPAPAPSPHPTPAAVVCSHDQQCRDSTLADNLTDNHTIALVKCVEGLCKYELGEALNKTASSKVTTGPSLHMLPIMIIMGMMFVGMCVALNLFSRARFKNNRSIFSNPRILKMKSKNAKKKGKRRRRGGGGGGGGGAGRLREMMENARPGTMVVVDDNSGGSEDGADHEDDQFVEISLEPLPPPTTTSTSNDNHNIS